MLGELRNIGTKILVGMALAILDIEGPVGAQEIAELEQIQRELQRRHHAGLQRVTPIADEDDAAYEEPVRTGGYSRR